ncbi:MAG: hypothetical protein HYT47_01650 [Candidatus Vogelbacteria bacterium]|nr:hypothetical protein [Candidatus Vogelbacteria bacterium]
MKTEQTEQTELRPFHETVVERIKCMSGDDVLCLSKILLETRISAGHDKIIKAWLKVCRERDREFAFQGGFDYDVPAGIIAQKQAAEAAATDLSRSFPYNGKERGLMVVIEKVIAVVQNLPLPMPTHLASALSHYGIDENDVGKILKLFETAKKIYSAKDNHDFQLALADLE